MTVVASVLRQIWKNEERYLFSSLSIPPAPRRHESRHGVSLGPRTAGFSLCISPLIATCVSIGIYNFQPIGQPMC